MIFSSSLTTLNKKERKRERERERERLTPDGTREVLSKASIGQE
jgi:hypothetical protein